MPIYESRCSACGHQEDHLQKVGEAPLTKCPACGRKKFEKQLTAAGFHLKGSGWYATDFKGGTQPARRGGTRETRLPYPKAGLSCFQPMKKYLITGLLIWIPLVITLWVLKLVVDVLDQTLLLLPPEVRTENWLGLHMPGMGAVMTLVIGFLTGLFATHLLGAPLAP